MIENGNGMDPQNIKLSRDLSLNWYVVAFLDLLGQKEKLINLENKVKNGNGLAIEDILPEVKESFGVTEGFKQAFENFFDKFNRAGAPPFPLSPDLEEAYYRLTKRNVSFTRFSDSIVIYQSISTQTTRTPFTSLFGILTGIAVVSLVHLAAGLPFRGGIDVGLGMEINGYFYGPGLFRAHDLESTKAEFPRVVVGDTLIDFINNGMSINGGSLEDQVNNLFASTSKKLIERDRHNCSFIDQFALEMATQTEIDQLNELYRKAYAYIEDSISHFEAKSNKKLLDRYRELEKYFRKNMKIRKLL